jgi:arylsulfatase A-like enzyme
VAETIVSFPMLFQELGYRTVMVTSNTLTSDYAFGFEDVFQKFDAENPYGFQIPSWEPFTGYYFLKKTLREWGVFKVIAHSPAHSTTYFDAPRLNRTVKRELSAMDTRPFLLYVHYMEPHSPYYRHPYRPLQLNLYTPAQREQILSAYRMEIGAVDRAIADLFTFLAEVEVLENTYVFITGDHGEEFHDHGNWGHGKSLYPETIHVPAILVLPHAQRRALRVAATVENIDIGPTFMDLIGGPQPDFWEGRSLVPLWNPVAEEEDAARMTTDRTSAAQYSVAFCQFDDGRVFWASVIQAGWQLIFKERGDQRRIMLFDLKQDPLAQHDRFGQGEAVETGLVSLLEANLRRWQATAELFRGQEEAIDPQHLEQLRALGYID